MRVDLLGQKLYIHEEDKDCHFIFGGLVLVLRCLICSYMYLLNVLYLHLCICVVPTITNYTVSGQQRHLAAATGQLLKALLPLKPRPNATNWPLLPVQVRLLTYKDTAKNIKHQYLFLVLAKLNQLWKVVLRHQVVQDLQMPRNYLWRVVSVCFAMIVSFLQWPSFCQNRNCSRISLNRAYAPADHSLSTRFVRLLTQIW